MKSYFPYSITTLILILLLEPNFAHQNHLVAEVNISFKKVQKSFYSNWHLRPLRNNFHRADYNNSNFRRSRGKFSHNANKSNFLQVPTSLRHFSHSSFYFYINCYYAYFWRCSWTRIKIEKKNKFSCYSCFRSYFVPGNFFRRNSASYFSWADNISCDDFYSFF